MAIVKKGKKGAPGKASKRTKKFVAQKLGAEIERRRKFKKINQKYKQKSGKRKGNEVEQPENAKEEVEQGKSFQNMGHLLC
jgi:hypothetical protein